MSTLVDVKGLEKNFTFKKVLRKIDLKIPKGSIFGLLGPNGVGKTTFVRCMLGLIPFDKGSITINGIPHSNSDARKSVAFVPDRFTFYPYYTVEKTLLFFAQINGWQKSLFNEEIDAILNKMGIGDLKQQKIKSLSKGQLQKVGLATLHFAEGDFFVLDEPFNGLDPMAMRDIKDIVRQFNKDGKTFLINSHLLSDMEQICDEVAIINKGSILVQKKIAELKSEGKNLEDYFCQLVGAPTKGLTNEQ